MGAAHKSLIALLGMPSGVGEKDNDGDDFDDLAGDLLDAIKDDNKKALALVLKRLLACKDDEPDEDDDGED